MLLTLVPLFDENMAVCAYSFFTQRENFLLNPLLLGTAQFDGASQITGLELIQKMGIDTLNHDSSISDLLNPNERIQNIVAKYKTGEL